MTEVERKKDFHLHTVIQELGSFLLLALLSLDTLGSPAVSWLCPPDGGRERTGELHVRLSWTRTGRGISTSAHKPIHVAQ